MSDLLTISASTLVGDLPCGYLVDGKAHSTFTVKEMTGNEEDILAGKGPVVQRLNTVIWNCLTQVGEITDRKQLWDAVTKLTAVDRMVLLVAIRRVSLGDDYVVKIQCPVEKCQKESTATLNLGELELKPMADRTQRVFEDTLTTGKKVKWHVMNGDDEVWLTTKAEKKEDKATLAMLARVDVVNGKQLYRADPAGCPPQERGKCLQEAVTLLKSMSMRERTELRQSFLKQEGSIDLEVEYKCPHCSKEFKGDMDVGQAGFFFPAGT